MGKPLVLLVGFPRAAKRFLRLHAGINDKLLQFDDAFAFRYLGVVELKEHQDIRNQVAALGRFCLDSEGIYLCLMRDVALRHRELAEEADRLHTSIKGFSKRPYGLWRPHHSDSENGLQLRRTVAEYLLGLETPVFEGAVRLAATHSEIESRLVGGVTKFAAEKVKKTAEALGLDLDGVHLISKPPK